MYNAFLVSILFLTGATLFNKFLLIFIFTSAFTQQDYKIIASYPHNTKSFTQGLFFEDGKLYEGTGKRKASKLLIADLKTGIEEKSNKLKDSFFGEGITKFGDKIIQLTWTSCTAFVYDFKSFKQIDSFTYQTEGWGITYDGTYLIVSDGSNKLSFYEADGFNLAYDITVSDWNGNVDNLNELEYVDGIIYANIYQQNDIVSIDPSSGSVIERYNFDTLVTKERNTNKKALELNGIAYNPKSKHFYITGKYWSKVYEVSLSK